MSEYEKFLFVEDAVQTFAAVMFEAEKKGIKIDPILLADLITTTQNNYSRIREFLFEEMSEEERFLKYEVLTRKFTVKGFLLGEIIDNKGTNNWTDTASKYLTTATKKHLSHKQSRKQCEYTYINSVRIPEKLYSALEILKDETQTVSSFVGNLLIKHRIHKVDPNEVLEFNRTLRKRYPKLFRNKRNRTFSIMLPAYLRWLVYGRRAKLRGLSNRDRELVGLAGLLWFLLLKREFPHLVNRLIRTGV